MSCQDSTVTNSFGKENSFKKKYYKHISYDKC